MDVICDPDCVGGLAECCHQLGWGFGLQPLPFSWLNVGKAVFYLCSYFVPDAIKGITALFFASLVFSFIPYPKWLETIKKGVKRSGSRK